jgi:hypothetical protein
MARAGARRFVAVRWLTEADDPAVASRELRDAIDRAVDAAPVLVTDLDDRRPRR